MLLTVTVRTHILKSGKRPPNTDAFVHLPGAHWTKDPRRVVPLKPRPGQTGDDVAVALLRVSQFDIDVPEDFWTMLPADVTTLVVDAVRQEVRRVRELRGGTLADMKESA